MTAVGFEPTPLRTGALSQRLRPLGQTVYCLSRDSCFAHFVWLLQYCVRPRGCSTKSFDFERVLLSRHGSFVCIWVWHKEIIKFVITNSFTRARGVVVSRLLRMQKALGSNPSGSSFPSCYVDSFFNSFVHRPLNPPRDSGLALSFFSHQGSLAERSKAVASGAIP